MSAPSAISSATLAQGFVGIGRIHLIGALVALERLGRTHRIAERSIEGRRIFRRIGEQQDIMMPRDFQCSSYGADAPVHHVRGREDIAAGFGLKPTPGRTKMATVASLGIWPSTRRPS